MEDCFGLCDLVWENLQANTGKHSSDSTGGCYLDDDNGSCNNRYLPYYVLGPLKLMHYL